MKNEFFKQSENGEIRNACCHILASFIKNEETKKILLDFIQKSDWVSLFDNEIWITTLRDSLSMPSNINPVLDQLLILKTYFDDDINDRIDKLVAKNKEIYLACESIRCLMNRFATNTKESSKNRLAFDEMIETLKKGSEIHLLIRNHNWKTLFTNECWLQILGASQSIIILEGNLISQLKIILKHFPRESKPYINADALNSTITNELVEVR